MDADFEKKVEESISAVTKMYRDKILPEEDYYRCMVSLAYEYAIGDKVLQAASIAQGIPRDYYQKVQHQQMLEDPNYAYISYSLALALFQAGYVHIGEIPAPTMGAATA